MTTEHQASPTASVPPPLPDGDADETPEEPRRRRFLTRFAGLPPTGLGPAAAALGVLIAAFAMIAGTIVVAVFDPDLESTAGRESAQAIVAIALIGTALGFALRDQDGRLRSALASLGLRAGPIAATVGLAILAWGIYLLFAAILAPLLQPEQEDLAKELGTDFESLGSILVAGLLIVIAAPLSEEIFFRGFMFAALRNSLPIWGAGLISAAVWGVLHLSAGNIGVAVQLTIFGLVLAWLYERSGNLWSPILAHTINNAIAFTLLVTDSV